MIINETELKRKNIATIIAAVAIGLLLIFMVANSRPSFPFYWTIAIELICGIILAISLYLCLNLETRLYGILFASLMVLTPIFSIIWGLISGNPVSLDVLLGSYGIGLLAGIAYLVFMLILDAEYRIWSALPVLLAVFVGIVTLIILIYSIILPISADVMAYGISIISIEYLSAYDIPTLYLICVLVLSIIIFTYLRHHKLGIEGSGVFVIGPPSSGKTYLAVGLYDRFTEKRRNDVISTPLPVLDTEIDAETQRKSVDLSVLRQNLLKDHSIRATKRRQLSSYSFYLKKLKFFSTNWTIIDFPGENYDALIKAKYETAVTAVKESLSAAEKVRAKSLGETEKVWSRGVIETMVTGNMKLINEVQEKYRQYIDEYEIFVGNLVTVIMYHNFIRSGKLIFLIDGMRLAKEWILEHPEDLADGADYYSVTSDGEVTKSLYAAFDEYNKILRDLTDVYNPQSKEKLTQLEKKIRDLSEHCSPTSIKMRWAEFRLRRLENRVSVPKKVAFVVTKTDYLYNNCATLQRRLPALSDIISNEDLQMYDQEIFNMVSETAERSGAEFGSLVRKLKKQNIPTYFITVSIDRHASETSGVTEDGHMHLFGFDSIETFGK